MKAGMGEMQLALSLRAQGASHTEVRNLVGVAQALAVVPDPEIDAAFADALEARLLTEGLELSPEVTPLRRPVRSARPARRAARPAFRPVETTRSSRTAAVVPLPRRRFVVRKAMAVAIAAAMMLALPVAAGAQALPSSPFYKVKIAMEDVRSFFTGGDLAKGFYELSRAQTRFDEASQLLALGDAEHAAKTISSMKQHQRKGTQLILGASPSPADLERVEDYMRDLVGQLQDLLPQADSASRSTILDAIRQAEAIADNLAGTTDMRLVNPADVLSKIAVDVQSPSGTTTQSPAGTTPGEDNGGGSNAEPEDPVEGGGKKVKDGVDEGCRVPGSANGLGDVVAPLAKVFCTQ